MAASPGAVADSDAQTELNAAWSAYQNAVAAGDAGLELDTARRAVAAGRRALPTNDPRLPSLLVNLGNALLEAGEGEAARDAFREAFDLCRKIHGARAPELIDPLEGMARAEGLLDDGFRQLKHFRRALGIAAEHFGPRSLEYAGFAVTAAVETYEDTGWTFGRPLLRRARDIYAEQLGEESIEVGSVEYQLGRLAYAQRSLDKALQCLERSLALLHGDDPRVDTYRGNVHRLLVAIHEEHRSSDKVLAHLLAISALNQKRGVAGPEPVLTYVPHYTWRMWSTDVKGHVDLSFTVGPTGKLRDVEVVEVAAEPDGLGRLIESAALRTVRHYRYAPALVHGEPVATEGMKLRIVFDEGGGHVTTYGAP